MNVTIEHTATITRDLTVPKVCWSAAPYRKFGEAVIVVPARDPAFSADYLDERYAQMRITIVDPVLGAWHGVARHLQFGEGGAVIEAIDLAWWLQSRPVSVGLTFDHCTAGTIVRAAVRDALGGQGAGAITPGSFVEAPPVIPWYEFRGQPAAQVVADMQDRTGQEWRLTGRRFDWVGRLGAPVEPHLCEDGDIVGTSKDVDVVDMVGEVTARGSDGTYYTARAGALGSGLWRAARTITVPTTSPVVLRLAAAAELARSRYPETVYQGQIRQTRTGDPSVNWWSLIREGSVLQCHLTKAGITDKSPLLRVLYREYTDGSPFLKVEFQHLPRYEANAPADPATEQGAPGRGQARRGSATRTLVNVASERPIDDAQLGQFSAGHLSDQLQDPQIRSLNAAKLKDFIDAWNNLTGGDASVLTTGTLASARLDATPGTVAPSKVVVVDANERIDGIEIASLKIGANGDTSLTRGGVGIAQITGVIAGGASSSQNLAASSTINHNGFEVARVNPSSNKTGIAIEAGTVDNQPLTVRNEHATNTITLSTTEATSRVQGSAGTIVIGAKDALRLRWNANDSRWYRE